MSQSNSSENILLSNKKCKRIFEKYNVIHNINLNDKEMLFIELCKIPNINYLYLKNCINHNTIDFYKKDDKNLTAYEYIFNNFSNEESYTNIKNNIESLKLFIKYINKQSRNILLNKINEKIKLFIENKLIYSSLKSLHIYIKKEKRVINDNSNIIDINSLIKKLEFCTDNIKILNIINKLLNNIEVIDNTIYLKNIINILNNFLGHDLINFNSFENILLLMNKCKNKLNNPNSELEKLLKSCNKNIYNYIYFLNNKKNMLISKDLIINFVSKLDYNVKSFKNIDALNLKRGFIFGLNKNENDYLLKYQPNKSLMELVINSYLKNYNYSNFLLPSNFFINNDNSYFYIIEKYKTDLYKYFTLLEECNKYLTFDKIINITNFIMESINILHNHDIIHCDLKLENIILNYDNIINLTDLKIIDFDVGLFNNIPQSLSIPEQYKKAFSNKKIRGTRIYMLKSEFITFKNDIYSLGVVSLILLYKNTKLALTLIKRSLSSDNVKNKKIIIKYQTLIKKMTHLRDNIEEDNNKIKMLNLISTILNKDENIKFFDNLDIDKYKFYKEFIIDCIKTKYNISELIKKYNFVKYLSNKIT